MRKSRFTEEQIIAALKEHAAGAPGEGDLPAAGGGGGDAVPLEAELRRHGGEQGQAAAALEDESRRLKRMVAETRR